MKLRILFLIFVALLLVACEKAEVTDAKQETLMNGAAVYRVKADGEWILVTKSVYELVEGYLVEIAYDEKLLCNFEKLPKSDITDMAACTVRK